MRQTMFILYRNIRYIQDTSRVKTNALRMKWDLWLIFMASTLVNNVSHRGWWSRSVYCIAACVKPPTGMLHWLPEPQSIHIGTIRRGAHDVDSRSSLTFFLYERALVPSMHHHSQRHTVVRGALTLSQQNKRPFAIIRHQNPDGTSSWRWAMAFLPV